MHVVARAASHGADGFAPAAGEGGVASGRPVQVGGVSRGLQDEEFRPARREDGEREGHHHHPDVGRQVQRGKHGRPARGGCTPLVNER